MRPLNVLVATTLFSSALYFLGELKKMSTDELLGVPREHRIYEEAIAKPAPLQETPPPAAQARVTNRTPAIEAEIEEVEWSDMQHDFIEALRQHLADRLRDESDDVIQRYLNRKKEFATVFTSLIQERDEEMRAEEDGATVTVLNKERFTELSDRIDAIQQQYEQDLREIFGDQYDTVLELKNNFNEDTHVYSEQGAHVQVML
jgi:hypothetical protein